jgi:hypothetical protein
VMLQIMKNFSEEFYNDDEDDEYTMKMKIIMKTSITKLAISTTVKVIIMTNMKKRVMEMKWR